MTAAKGNESDFAVMFTTYGCVFVEHYPPYLDVGFWPTVPARSRGHVSTTLCRRPLIGEEVWTRQRPATWGFVSQTTPLPLRSRSNAAAILSTMTTGIPMAIASTAA